MVQAAKPLTHDAQMKPHVLRYIILHEKAKLNSILTSLGFEYLVYFSFYTEKFVAFDGTLF